MRRALLWMATMCVGGATFLLAVAAMAGDTGATLGAIAFWLLALAMGLALSAPAFLAPPEDGGGLWVFRLPLPLWLFLIMIKLMSWTGFYVLLGCWTVIFKLKNSHSSGTLPSFHGRQPQPAQPYAPQRPVLPPASWQRDPSGRYPHRFWDGNRWTDHVANGNVRAVDPLWQHGQYRHP